MTCHSTVRKPGLQTFPRGIKIMSLMAQERDLIPDYKSHRHSVTLLHIWFRTHTKRKMSVLNVVESSYMGFGSSFKCSTYVLPDLKPWFCFLPSKRQTLSFCLPFLAPGSWTANSLLLLGIILGVGGWRFLNNLHKISVSFIIMGNY